MASEVDGIKIETEADPATWTVLEEKIFIQLMVKEVHKGNRSTTTFSRKGWKSIEQEFRARTSKRYNNCQLRNKFNQLRTRYHDFSKLLQEPGVNWDPVLNTVSAPENIWELYLKVNKKAKRFQKKGCSMFNELGVIFGNPSPKYKDVFPLAQYPFVKEDNIDLEDTSTNATPSGFPCESGDDKDYTSQNSLHHLRSPTPSSYLGGKREARTLDIVEGLREWTEVTKPITPIFIRSEASPQSNAFSITNCVKCLESIEGVDGSTYIKAIKMFKDVDWREMFMAMSAERRLVWLASLE
ncbi:L10-interacting MYB domain-containing protein-like [Pistacia vera]|uniref:L10-interacting MYB domain-containing protein-like n=1 Tax=Pistacia vera TaxID=55513 RepID=UPI001263A687|nr:L10-interacting MYB domain-containing protein-like [Pistacia vera]